MSTQFLLDENDIKELTKLMLVMIETQESRKQLCRDLGINPQEISFIRDSSDDTFCTELIDCLNRYGYQEYLCKLCCQKLFPIFNKSVYSHRTSTLKKIVEKLNCDCNHEFSNIYSNTQNLTEVSTNGSKFGGGISIIVAVTGVVVFFGGGLMYYLKSQSQQSPSGTYQSYQKSCLNMKVDGDLLSATCRKRDGSYNNTSIRILGIENINGVLTFNNSYSYSSYQKSCLNIQIGDGDLLSATCIKTDGSYSNTSIRIPGIENINGVLTFNNSYNSSSWISKPASRSPDEVTKPYVKA